MENTHNLLPHELMCEIPECNERVQDVHHILGKGKYPELKNDINNLIGLCRNHHEKFGQKKQYIDYLKLIKSDNINKK